MSFYAVRAGRKTGIFYTWVECEQQVKGFSGASYKKFKSYDEAQRFISTAHNATAVRKRKELTLSDLQEMQEQREIERVLREALEKEDML